VTFALSSLGESLVKAIRYTPYNCWLVIEVDGVIVCAHCNCMAGLGETCTHIVAVLFYLEAVARLQGMKTVTESARLYLPT